MSTSVTINPFVDSGRTGSPYGHLDGMLSGIERRRRLSRDHRTKAAGFRDDFNPAKRSRPYDTNKPEVVEEQDEEGG
jgi:hypothetical protein